VQRNARDRAAEGLLAPEVYAALWLGALLAATGAPIDPFPSALTDLARRYFERYSPEVKA
jgi:hypothetical protein